jgi:hypothetical protein
MEKSTLTKDGKNLKIFFYTVQLGPVQVQVKEEAKLILAYDATEANIKVTEFFPVGTKGLVKNHGSLPVSMIVDTLELIPKEINVPPSFQEPEDPRKTFICNTLLLADKFVSSKTDKATIKKILNKIKLDGK